MYTVHCTCMYSIHTSTCILYSLYVYVHKIIHLDGLYIPHKFHYVEGDCLFGVPSRFALNCLYSYCIACSSRYKVGPVLEINRSFQWYMYFSQCTFMNMKIIQLGGLYINTVQCTCMYIKIIQLGGLYMYLVQCTCMYIKSILLGGLYVYFVQCTFMYMEIIQQLGGLYSVHVCTWKLSSWICTVYMYVHENYPAG